MKAMLDDPEVNMREEVDALAKYDPKFNETFKNYVENDDDGFVMGDHEVINSKESIFWKMYNKKYAEKQAREKDKENRPFNVSLEPSPGPKLKEVPIADLEPKFQKVLRRTPPVSFKCPKCDEKPKKASDAHGFRFHFFTHYKDHFEDWEERLEGLEKGEKHYYCDICVPKKQVKGATEEGAKKSVICHLAIQHHELRDKLEKDPELSKEFVMDIYYDVDLKKVTEELKDQGIQAVDKPSEKAPQPAKEEETPKPPTPVKPNNKPGPASSKKVTPNKPGPKSKTQTPTPTPPSSNKKPKIGPKSKTQTPTPTPPQSSNKKAKPGPKSRTKRKNSESEENEDTVPNFDSDGSEAKIDRSKQKMQNNKKAVK